MVFLLFISFVVMTRITELLLSKRNEQWLLKNNATEYGRNHYPYIVLLHVFFMVSMMLEYALRPAHSYSSILLGLYMLLIAFKLWVILSLGKFWNTKIYRIHDVPLVRKGPYKFLKHPNYLIVIAEIAIIPLVFHLYCTAVIFTILNLMILYVRISEEDRALNI